jgi:hypothetical protein
MSDEDMQKYGVDETITVSDISDIKEAQYNTQRYCPWCGRLLLPLDTLNVLCCPIHGTRPFEKPPK